MRQISIDPGSSLVTGLDATSVDVAALQDQTDEHQDVLQAHVDDYEGQTLNFIKDLKEQGFEIKKPFAKNSWKQGKIESIIKSLKKCFYACQLPGTTPLTIISFINVVKRCAALVNSRPVAIIRSSLADPDEILSCSPNS